MSQSNNNVVRASRNKNYKTIGCDFLDDKELSYKAKGILTYLLTRPDNWNFSKVQVMGMSDGGEVSFESGIKELKERGYLRIEKSRAEDGQYLYEWFPTETAIFIVEVPVAKPDLEKPDPENPPLENRPLYHIGNNIQDKTTRKKHNTNITREANKAPSLPTMIADTIQIGHSFPYEGSQIAVSAVWYWAVKRFERHKIDFFITQDGFKKMLFKYVNTVPKSVGRSFEDQKKYIDWYLSSKEDFIEKQTQWGFDYLSSSHCVNRYLPSKGQLEKLILTAEDRKNVKGKWLK